MNHKEDYTDINSRTWDQWANRSSPYTIPVSHETYLQALAGQWEIYLTPCLPVPKTWFGNLRGKEVLALASGGGQQVPILAAAGAKVTLVDYSDAQLEADLMVMSRENYQANIIKADMSKPLPFESNFFDMIVHPVANVYIEDVRSLWHECYRVLKKEGSMLAGLDNGINFLIDEEKGLPLTVSNKLPYNPLQGDPEELRRMIEQGEGIQFSHTLDDQIGGQLKAGFVLLDLYEDRNFDGLLKEYAPQYFCTLAKKP